MARGRRVVVPVVAVAILGAVVAALALGRTGPEPAPVETPTAAPAPADDLTSARVDELRDFIDWLDANDAEGFVGEVGWPAEPPESTPWNALADDWYRTATDAGLWTTAWASGNVWDPGYKLVVYADTDRDAVVESPYSQAEVVERYPSGDGVRTGVNVAGLEFGAEGPFSNATPGEPSVDYFEESAETFRFLASRGIDTVRLPFRWERVQSQPLGELRATGVAELRRALDLAGDAGIDVILDLHNYGSYITAEGPQQLGTAALSAAALADVWVRLGAELGDHPALLAYGLMNEPSGFAESTGLTGAELWERVSQVAVDGIRAAGDTTLVMVPGYDFSAVSRFTQNHPRGWITDPAHNFRYEAHQYWDADASGNYYAPYAELLTAAAD
jgi:sugar phosphate isomerase/epimerase